MKRYKGPVTNLDQCVLGTAGLGGIWGKVSQKESVRTILESLESGVTVIDTAPAYGDAEQFVGDALRQWEGAPPRICIKAGRLKSYATDECFYDYSTSGLEKSVRNSLRALNIPAADVLFLHEPSAVPVEEVEGVVEKILELKHKGYAKRIGLGGNSPEWFSKYINAHVFDVVMEYNRLNACCLDALNTSLPECVSRGVEFWAASPLHMGLLGDSFELFTKMQLAWLPEKDVKRAIDMKEIADRHGIPLPSLSHRFLLSLPNHFKIVIGAKNSRQLRNSLSDFRKGPLPGDIYTEIRTVLPNKFKDASD